MNLFPYIAITRPDNWTKNLLVLPGMGFALLLYSIPLPLLITNLLLGILSICAITSANYTINEWLDRESDKNHPVKKNRPAARGLVSAKIVYALYSLLCVIGLLLAANINAFYLITSLMLLIMGVAYNVKPLRLKDKPYFDVLSESINNPIRFVLGWALISPDSLPPSSVLLAYWMGGAFLMTVKRLAEYRFIHSKKIAVSYRPSFKHYDEPRLLLFALFCALNSSFFLGIFLIKYRIEYLLSFPFFAVLFTWYLFIAFKPDSVAQRPHKLYKEHGFSWYVIFVSALVFLLTYVNIPALHTLEKPNLIEMPPLK